MSTRSIPGATARRARALLMTVAAVSLAGCGIRSTDVPVDAGPAPSRATCTQPESNGGGVPVYLVCGSRVEPVERPVALPGQQDDPGARVAMARALLAELQTEPEQEERTAGFSSAVPSRLTVSGPVGDDPERALRLDPAPGELPAVALVQVICTFAGAQPIGDGLSVLLGGPPDAPGSDPHRYSCSTGLRHSPEAARTAGAASAPAS
ncbi:lipoprotein [Streptomyces sodiiphilus]|uniref:Lipoprotein n=1 Tax=Streptomyces sodiiphilus TaxID=226217 RepID=A0ABN2NY46_9ACTN